MCHAVHSIGKLLPPLAFFPLYDHATIFFCFLGTLFLIFADTNEMLLLVNTSYLVRPPQLGSSKVSYHGGNDSLVSVRLCSHQGNGNTILAEFKSLP
jgi:hypothetical protein